MIEQAEAKAREAFENRLRTGQRIKIPSLYCACGEAWNGVRPHRDYCTQAYLNWILERWGEKHAGHLWKAVFE